MEMENENKEKRNEDLLAEIKKLKAELSCFRKREELSNIFLVEGLTTLYGEGKKGK